ncbi:MAG: hypothetical protein KDD78_13370, partial [Caldilineaceae bacterium]|nr:hypothetical protein [Caldilineaceae bacterium]
RQVGDKAGEATTLSNIGAVYDALGEKAKALDTFNHALTLCVEVRDRFGEVVTRCWLGLLYADEDRDLGEEHLRVAAEIADVVHSPHAAAIAGALARLQSQRQ